MRANRLFYLTIVVVFWCSSYAAAVTVDDVAHKLSCFCGTCPHLVVSDCGCPVADEIKADVKKMIAAGMTEDQILDDFVAQHGQTILSAPPARGFNLTAWLVPFGGFLAGAFALAVFLRRQRKNDDPQNSNGKASKKISEEVDEYYREQLNKELEQRK